MCTLLISPLLRRSHDNLSEDFDAKVENTVLNGPGLTCSAFPRRTVTEDPRRRSGRRKAPVSVSAVATNRSTDWGTIVMGAGGKGERGACVIGH